MFSIADDVHMNSRRTNIAPMSCLLASPSLVRIHRVETSSVPLTSLSLTFSDTGKRVQELDLFDVGQLNLLIVPLFTRQLIEELFHNLLFPTLIVMASHSWLKCIDDRRPLSGTCLLCPRRNAATILVPFMSVPHALHGVSRPFNFTKIVFDAFGIRQPSNNCRGVQTSPWLNIGFQLGFALIISHMQNRVIHKQSVHLSSSSSRVLWRVSDCVYALINLGTNLLFQDASTREPTQHLISRQCFCLGSHLHKCVWSHLGFFGRVR